MKEKIKSGLIIALAILIVLVAIFGGSKVKKYVQDIRDLKYANKTLEMQKAFLETQVKFEQAKVEKRDSTIDSCMVVFKKKDKQIASLSADLTTALDKLEGITSDSSYIFLTQVAYNYPGLLSYIFNENQIKRIHADYLRARSADKIIPVYEQAIANCKFQMTERDSIEAGLKRIVLLRNKELDLCEQANANKDIIIKDTEKQKEKAERRKGFWRSSAGIMTGVAVIVAVFL